MARHRSTLAALVAVSLAMLGPAVVSQAETGTRSGAAVAEASQRPARQVARLQMHPQIADSSGRVRSAASAKSAMTATFRPKSKGRPVKLAASAG